MKKSIEKFLRENRPMAPEAPAGEKADLLQRVARLPQSELDSGSRLKNILWPWKLMGSGFAIAALFAFLMVLQTTQKPTQQVAEKEEIGEFLLSTFNDYSGALDEDAENYF